MFPFVSFVEIFLARGAPNWYNVYFHAKSTLYIKTVNMRSELGIASIMDVFDRSMLHF